MENIQYFLDRLYISRISTRMLINQHTALFTELDKVNFDWIIKEVWELREGPGGLEGPGGQKGQRYIALFTELEVKFWMNQ